MAGSDRVLDPYDSKRAQVGKRKTFYESETALFFECMRWCARNVLDSADIVRDGDVTTVIPVAVTIRYNPVSRIAGKMR